MKKIKTVLCVLLCVTVCFVGTVPCGAFSAVVRTDIPVVLISGDSIPIVDEEQNNVFCLSEPSCMFSRLLKEGESYPQMILRKGAGIYYTYYLGCLTGNFDAYYDVMYNLLADGFEQSRLDKDGNPQYNTDIPAFRRQEMENSLSPKSSYWTESFHFNYDWRLDPLETAAELNDYIKQVKSVTGYDKIGIICRCLGANVFLAYVSLYGMDDICGVGFDGVVAGGSEMLTDPNSGGTQINLFGLARLLQDVTAAGMLELDPAVPAAVNAFAASGVFDFITFMVKFPNYSRLEKGVTSALSLSTVFTWPNYWAGVSPEKYQTALEYVFGPEGSDLRAEYAGLIAKLDRYDRDVRQKLPELLKTINDNANFAIISKYGMQPAPFTVSQNIVGDQYVSVPHSSFGAVASTIYEPLSEEYLAAQRQAGKGMYLSPDGQIDASTCLLPDQTFFIKGSSHSDWTEPEMELLAKIICADKQLTVRDLPDSQFAVYDYATDTAAPMTAENCHCENWTINKNETSANPLVKPILFCKAVIALIKISAQK